MDRTTSNGSSVNRKEEGGKRRAGGESRGRFTGGRGKKSAAEPPDSYSTLGKLVSKATKPTRESGYKRLDEDTLRRIKAVARQDEDCAAGAIRYLMRRMEAKSAEVRFMALSIVGHLFQRSRVVRGVLVADLKNFMNLAVGHDARHPLPGPPAAAAALRQRALALMEEWNEAHGDIHKGLRAAYRFLREGKRMRFPELQARAAREREAAARRERQAQRLLRAKYVQAKGEIEEQAPEIEAMVREMQECFSILVPAVPGTDALSTTAESSLSAALPDLRDGADAREGATVCEDEKVGDNLGLRPSTHDEGSTDAGDPVEDEPTGSIAGAPGAGLDGGNRVGLDGADEGVDDMRSSHGDGGDARTGDLGEESRRPKTVAGEPVSPARQMEDDSDDDEGVEWEDGGDGGGGDGFSDDEGEEAEEGTKNGGATVFKRQRGGGREEALRTVADTVEAAGLGSSGYELQVEVPTGWSLTTTGDGGDAALVVSALRERYKVLTSRILPLLSDWVQTLSRVQFDEDTTTAASSIGSAANGSSGRALAPPHSSALSESEERRACASLLGRCLAARNSANTVVSKFLELQIDEADGGGGEAAMSAGVRRAVGGVRSKIAWPRSTKRPASVLESGSGSAAVTVAAKKTRFQIRLGDARH